MINLVIDPRDPELEPLGISADGSAYRPVKVTVAPSRVVRLAAGGFLWDGAPVVRSATTTDPITVQVPATDGLEIHVDDRSTFEYSVKVECDPPGHGVGRGPRSVTFRGMLPLSLGATVQVTALDPGQPVPAPFVSVAQVLGSVSDEVVDQISTAGTPARTALEAAAGSAYDAGTTTLVTGPSATRTALDARYGGAPMLAPLGDDSTDQLAALQSGMNTAATFGLPYALNGKHVVNGELTLPTGLTLDGSRGSLRQTGNSKRTLLVNGTSRVTVRGVTITGKMTDYANNSGVYLSSGIYVMGAATDVRILDCTISGATGITVTDAPTRVTIRGNRLVGPGSSVITNNTFNYGAGVAINSAATAGKWSVEFNDISGFAQGIVTGEFLSDVRIVGNYVHDIPGQHGLYLETMTRGVIANNIVTNCSLLGMKIQIATNAAGDATDVTIANNVFTTCGDHGILLTNTVGSPTGRLRRISINANVITDTAGPGIGVNNAVGLAVTNNVIANASNGVFIATSSRVTVMGNRITSAKWNGVSLNNVQDYSISHNRITDSGQNDVATDEFGIKIDNAGTAEGFILGNVITDTTTHMRYGIYVIAGDLTTHSFQDNYVTGATDYGWRATTAANARSFRGNTFAGALGSMLTPPSNFAQNADTSGATLTALETEVNELKAVLRAAGLIRA